MKQTDEGKEYHEKRILSNKIKEDMANLSSFI